MSDSHDNLLEELGKQVAHLVEQGEDRDDAISTVTHDWIDMVEDPEAVCRSLSIEIQRSTTGAFFAAQVELFIFVRSALLGVSA